MAFYDLNKEERTRTSGQISMEILADLKASRHKKTAGYFSDEDTYILSLIHI